MPTTDNPLERAFMARVRSEEYAADLKTLQSDLDDRITALQEEFNAREDVIDLKRKIERCEEERRNCIEQAKTSGISKMGSFLLRIRTRKTRTVIPAKFFARFGAETFVACSTVAIGKAEAAVGKGAFDDCCEVDVKETGVTVEYERQEGDAE
ncbi:MAG: hypothetical protein WC277_06515 [Bacilli bacterium]|jgi:hypothetical protein